MQKCPLCDKKIPGDAKLCPECGWDLTEHELTVPQMVRIQEEIQYTRFRAMQIHVVMVPFLIIGVVCSVVGIFAAFKVVPATWDFIINVAWPFYFIGIGLSFYEDQHRKKQDRVRMMLRNRHPSQ